MVRKSLSYLNVVLCAVAFYLIYLTGLGKTASEQWNEKHYYNIS